MHSIILGNSYLSLHKYKQSTKYLYMHYGSVALLSHNTLKRSAILGLSFLAQCWWPRESVLWGSSVLSEFRTSLALKSANTLPLCQSKATIPVSLYLLHIKVQVKKHHLKKNILPFHPCHYHIMGYYYLVVL